MYARHITLTTDFGAGSPYVAAMKGVILGINPDARITDLSHDIPPQDLRSTSHFVSSTLPYFLAGTIHVIVVDPGVGTERALLLVEIAGIFLLAPDNGCWTALAKRYQAPPTVIRLTEPRFWRPQISATFHGRDILAPVAAHLSHGTLPREFGTVVTSWNSLDLPEPIVTTDRLSGEVVYVDSFGNLVTNIPGHAYRRWHERDVRIVVGNHGMSERVRTYAEAPPGTLVALVSSGDTLEIALTNGNAARRLGVGIGTPVFVQLL